MPITMINTMIMTSTLTYFIIACFLVSVVMALIGVSPWLIKDKNFTDNQLMSVNIDTFKQRLIELKKDVDNGWIDLTHYESQKIELQHQLLQAQSDESTIVNVSSITKLALCVVIIVLSISAYLLVSGGSRIAVFNLWQSQETMGEVADDLLTGKISTPPNWAIKSPIEVADLIVTMQTNVHQNSTDGQRWLNLSAAFAEMGASDSALQAMKRAYRLDPNNTTISLKYAQNLFFINGGLLNTDISKILTGILTQEPTNQRAQLMLAVGESSAGNYDVALGYISNLRQQLILDQSNSNTSAIASLDKLAREVKQQQQLSYKP